MNDLRPAHIYTVNKALALIGAAPIDDSTPTEKLAKLGDALEPGSDHSVIRAAVEVLRGLEVNKSPFPTTPAAGTVEGEAGGLPPEGVAALESTFGVGYSDRRGLTDGGRTINALLKGL